LSVNSALSKENHLKDEQRAFMNAASFKEVKAQFEKAFIIKELKEFNGNISQTA